jgi:hypothetical protein
LLSKHRKKRRAPEPFGAGALAERRTYRVMPIEVPTDGFAPIAACIGTVMGRVNLSAVTDTGLLTFDPVATDTMVVYCEKYTLGGVVPVGP